MGKPEAYYYRNGLILDCVISRFQKKLQQEITNFVNQGGNIFISGQYIVSDLYDSRSSEGSIDFAQKVLGISKGEGSVSYSGSLSINAGAMDSNIKNLL